MDSLSQKDFTVASTQDLSLPMKVPDLEAFVLTVNSNGRPTVPVVRNQAPSEFFLRGITWPADSCRHGHLPNQGRCIREILPAPTRWGSLRGYAAPKDLLGRRSASHAFAS